MNKDDVAGLIAEFREHTSFEHEASYGNIFERGADALTTLSAENEALQARVDVLEAALRFYARENSWKSCGVYMCGHSQPSSAEVDRGNKARKALEGKSNG